MKLEGFLLVMLAIFPSADNSIHSAEARAALSPQTIFWVSSLIALLAAGIGAWKGFISTSFGRSKNEGLGSGGSGPGAPGIAAAVPFIIISFFLVSMLVSGCALLKNPQSNARIAAAAKSAFYFGTHEAVKEFPDRRAKFQAGADSLAVLENSDTITLGQVLEVLQSLPVQKLHSDTAEVIITSATILISGIDFPTVDAERVAELRPIVSAIRQGIQQGLGP